ncbi:MAG: cyclic nucleotide-binding domain-containing protein [Verrucomicrobiota bacterium]
MFSLEWLTDLPIRSFHEGERIISEGTRSETLLFLKKGRVEVVREMTRVAVIRTQGSVIGELSILLNRPTTAEVFALEDTEFFVAEDPLDFLRKNPEVNLQVSRTLAYRLNAASEYLVDVKDQLNGCSDHVGMVDGVLGAILHRDLKRKVEA